MIPADIYVPSLHNLVHQCPRCGAILLTLESDPDPDFGKSTVIRYRYSPLLRKRFSKHVKKAKFCQVIKIAGKQHLTYLVGFN